MSREWTVIEIYQFVSNEREHLMHSPAFLPHYKLSFIICKPFLQWWRIFDNVSEQVYGSQQPRSILPCPEKAWFMFVADTGLYWWWCIRRCTPWIHIYAMEDETTHVSTTAIVLPTELADVTKSCLFVSIKNAGCDYIIHHYPVMTTCSSHSITLHIVSQTLENIRCSGYHPTLENRTIYTWGNVESGTVTFMSGQCILFLICVSI